VLRIREHLVAWDLPPKAILAIVGAGVLLLLILAAPYFFGGGTKVEVTGVVVAPFEQPSDTGNSYYMRVRIESGEEVRVPISRSLLVRPGKTVVLTKTSGTRIGAVWYRFVRYADAGA
jgi:hypothetical protein